MRWPILHRFSSLLGAHIWREVLQSIFLLWLARRNPAGYGEVMLAFQFGAIFLFLSEAGMNPYLVQHLTHAPAHRHHWMRRFAWIRLLLLLLIGVAVWGFMHLQEYTPHLQLLVLGLGGAIGFDALVSSYFAGLQVSGRQAQEGKVRIWGATLGWGYSLAALAAGWGVFRLSIGKWIESLTNLVGAVRQNPPDTEAPEDDPAVHSSSLAWRDALPYAAIAAAAILFNKANIFFLQHWGGSEAVGQYSATWQLVDGLPILVSNLLLGRVLYPVFVLKWRTDPEALGVLVRQTVRWLSLVALTAVLILGRGSIPLIHLLYGPAYGEAAQLQPLLVWCIPFALLHNVAAYLLLAAGRQRFLVGAYVAALLLNLLLCRWLIPGMPLSGAAWAIVVTKGALAAATVTAACRCIPFWRLRTLGVLAATALGAWGIFQLTNPAMGSWALIPACLPPLGVAWHWWREHIRQNPPDSGLHASESSG